jgi:hypothetical protein
MRNKQEQRRRKQAAEWVRLRMRISRGNLIAIPYTVADLREQIGGILAVGMTAWVTANRARRGLKPL